MPEVTQRSFTGGVISPSLHNRADLAKYQTSLATLLNFFVQTEGGVSNRPGTTFIKEVDDSTVLHRLIEFEFNTEQAYPLVFGDQTLQVVRNGGAVLNSFQSIVSATQANPVVLEVTAHGYTSGDEVFVDSGGDMVEINGRFFKITVLTANTFSLQDYDGNDIDGTGFTAYTSGGQAADVYTEATNFIEADLFDLRFTQSADVMTLVHEDYDPEELTRTDHNAWVFSTIDFSTQQAAPTGLTLGTTGAGGGANTKTYEYVVTAVNTDGEESLPSTAANHTVASLSATFASNLTWTAPAGTIDYYNIYKAESAASDVYGLIGTSVTTTFDDFNIAPDLSFGPPSENLPFSGVGNKPRTVNFYQQRRVFAGSINNPQTCWITESGNYNSFRQHRPLLDSDGIEFTLASKRVNSIRHVVALDALLLLTSGGEWKVTEGQDEVLTPSTVGVRQQSYNGSAGLEPLVIDNSALYLQDKGSRVKDFGYTFESDSYTGSDLSILARHLFRAAGETYTITDWCYQKEPWGIIWAVRIDGSLLSFTYQKEQQVWGWGIHETDGEYESCIAIPEGDEDAVYFIVKRTINGSDKRYIERLHTRIMPDITDAFFVDCGLTYDQPITMEGATQANPVVVTSTAHGLANGTPINITKVVGMTELNGGRYKIANVTANTFELQDTESENIDGTGFTAYISGGEIRERITTLTNLHHLEGKTVAVLADGYVVKNKTVSNGQITLGTPAGKIHVGLPYTSDLETLSIDSNEQTTRGRLLNVNFVTISFKDSRGGFIGPNFDQLQEIKPRSIEDGYSVIDYRTREVRQSLPGKWSAEAGGKVCYRQIDPLPVTILSISPSFDISK